MEAINGALEGIRWIYGTILAFSVLTNAMSIIMLFWIKPWKDKKKTVSNSILELQEMSKHLDERLDRVEKHNKENFEDIAIVLETMLLMMRHMTTGNCKQEMKDQTLKLNSYLTTRSKKGA